ncbi:hypothetical protein EDD29_4639 [Actinocorallia herbida]|uniref:Ig-like domain-containing protein n=1 Tax=Actinocorallia herbida TaxID=58109 RepID=A0A3N1D0L7_9ACTN|nr:hypothetical protein [Actinocorallia herbida]ROO87050.1 hypothetical protein EDD29_4639 [Actinocorallia herbida]
MRKKTTSTLVLASVVALGAQAAPAAAATTTWTVVNPDANGGFTATAPGLTVQSGSRTLFTCAGSVTIQGSIASKSNSDVALGGGTVGWTPECTGADGSTWAGILSVSAGPNTFRASAYNASTGVTTLNHSAPASFPVWTWVRTDSDGTCWFIATSVAATYTNATSVLKTTTAKVYVPPTANGVPNCVGQVTDGATLTHTASFKVTPAIKITAVTS